MKIFELIRTIQPKLVLLVLLVLYNWFNNGLKLKQTKKFPVSGHWLASKLVR